MLLERLISERKICSHLNALFRLSDYDYRSICRLFVILSHRFRLSKEPPYMLLWFSETLIL